MNLNFKGKNALVLGASSGIGFSIASQISKLGANVAIVGRDEIKLNLALKNLKTQSLALNVFGIKADLTQADSVATIIDRIKQDFSNLDFLILNTGGPAYHESILDVPTQEWHTYFQSMFMSQIQLVEDFIPQMKLSGFGRVVTIGSSSIIEPLQGLGISNTLRAALIAWLKTLASEVAEYGITINTVIPGKIDTERLANLETVRGKSIDSIPMGRYGRVEEMANAVAFLLSEYASYTTGSSIIVDGGMLKRSV